MNTPDDPTYPRRQPLGWLVLALATGLVGGMAAGCNGRTSGSGGSGGSGGSEARDAASDDASAVGLPADSSRDAEAGVRLVLTIEPQIGDAPLQVELRATLEGDLDEPDRFRCATAAFALGDDNVQLIPPPDDCTDDVQRTFTTTHTYAAAGSYRASVRLIARPVAPSKPVQVLVRGATPTAVPVAANPGPTIVIATRASERPTELVEATDVTRATELTARADAPERSATPLADRPTRAARASTARLPEATRDRTTVVARAPAASATPPPSSIRTGSARSPSATAPAATPASGMLAVLPADLYYLNGAPPQLWRLPASGDEPEALDRPGEVTDDYAVSSIGFVARQQGGTISVQTPTGSVRTLFQADPAVDTVWGPVWSRDGHLLAYNVNGRLRIFDVVTYSEREIGASGGAPMAFSRDGKWLLEGLDNGALGLVEIATGDARFVPLDEGVGQSAGWLPDRNVLWSTGFGLRFVTVGDPLTITPVIEPDIATSSMFVRSDQRALVLVERGTGAALAQIDLTAQTISAEIVGAPIDIATRADLAWAPDGRTIAVAGEKGLALVDPATGARVPLIDGPTRDPTWVLGGR